MIPAANPRTMASPIAEKPKVRDPIAVIAERMDRERAAEVAFQLTYLRTPLNWCLRIWGQGTGGYVTANGSVSRFADKAAAEQAAAVWIETGIYPSHQTAERIAEARRMA